MQFTTHTITIVSAAFFAFASPTLAGLTQDCSNCNDCIQGFKMADNQSTLTVKSDITCPSGQDTAIDIKVGGVNGAVFTVKTYDYYYDSTVYWDCTDESFNGWYCSPVCSDPQVNYPAVDITCQEPGCTLNYK
eukprot:Pgem_evm1s6304